jgi:hypothetical protein
MSLQDEAPRGVRPDPIGFPIRSAVRSGSRRWKGSFVRLANLMQRAKL